MKCNFSKLVLPIVLKLILVKLKLNVDPVNDKFDFNQTLGTQRPCLWDVLGPCLNILRFRKN